MSEEEIIKILEDRLENSNQYVFYHSWVGTECFDAIRGLLDLYNKEKEKNKELNRLKGFEMLDIFNMGKESSRQRIEHDWVEKEKIREKLKEEQERLKAGFGKMYEENLGNSATRILQELLEERN